MSAFIVYLVVIKIFIGEKKQSVGIKKINAETVAKKEYPNAPDFALYDLTGKLVRLSDHKGKVVIIDFWATWCGPCRIGIPDFIEIQNKYGKEKLMILGINLDQGDLSVVVSFAKVYKINYPILFYTPEVIEAYGGIRGIPTTFIVDREGKIREKLVGYHYKDHFIQMLNKIL
jgi:cytochrome c biogenesis protein CcmG/thiol:disulfide interchange protein DsbE